MHAEVGQRSPELCSPMIAAMRLDVCATLGEMNALRMREHDGSNCTRGSNYKGTRADRVAGRRPQRAVLQTPRGGGRGRRNVAPSRCPIGLTANPARQSRHCGTVHQVRPHLRCLPLRDLPWSAFRRSLWTGLWTEPNGVSATAGSHKAPGPASIESFSSRPEPRLPGRGAT